MKPVRQQVPASPAPPRAARTQPPTPAPVGAPAPGSILGLQQTHGNRHVQRLIQRQPAGPSPGDLATVTGGLSVGEVEIFAGEMVVIRSWPEGGTMATVELQGPAAAAGQALQVPKSVLQALPRQAPAPQTPTVPSARIVPKDGGTLEVHVEGHLLATVSGGTAADLAVAVSRDAEGRLAAAISVLEGMTVKDHNPMGDGPSRLIALTVQYRKPQPQPKAPATPGPQPAKPEKAAPAAGPETAKQRAQKVRDFLPWYRMAGGMVKIFQSCTPQEFQELQDELGSDMDEVIDQLSPFDAVHLGTFGPVVASAEALNRKRAEFIVKIVFDSGDVAPFYLIWMFSQMHTDDIDEVLTNLMFDRYFARTIGEPGMVSVRKLLRQRGIDLSLYVDREFQASDAGRAVLEFLGDTLAGDSKGGVESSWRKSLPEDFQNAIIEMRMKQAEAALTPGNIALGQLNQLMMGLPLGIYGAGKGLVTGTQKFASGKPEEGIKEVLPAVTLILGLLLGRALRGKAPKGAGAAGTAGAEAAAEAAAGAEAAEGTLAGPKGKGQFSLPGYQGPVSPAAARIGALLQVGAEVEGAAGVLVERLGPAGIQRVAGYVQGNSAAARLVIQRGMPALEALLAAEGDVAKASAILGKPAPGLPPATTPGAAPAAAASPAYGASVGEAMEAGVIQEHYPNGQQLPAKFKAYDVIEGGAKVETLSAEGPAKKRVMVVNQTITGGRWISIKSILEIKDATVANIQKVVGSALRDMYNDLHNPSGRKPSYDPEPVAPGTHWRVIKDSPDRVTLHVKLPVPVTAELEAAARDAAANSKYLPDLPPFDLVVTGTE